jgi:hypothetical protein
MFSTFSTIYMPAGAVAKGRFTFAVLASLPIYFKKERKEQMQEGGGEKKKKKQASLVASSERYLTH